MGEIADRVAQMRGCSLRQIVETIAAMEDAALDIGPSDFEKLWAAYPHKVAKTAALKAYTAARKRKLSAAFLMDAVSCYVAEKPVDRPWLNLSTFINQSRWNDRPAMVGGNTVSSFFGEMADYYGEDGSSGDRGTQPSFSSAVRVLPAN